MTTAHLEHTLDDKTEAEECGIYTILHDPILDLAHRLSNATATPEEVRCLNCGNVWVSNALIPRCHRCKCSETEATTNEED
jgi:hypothetical protein